MEETNYRTVCRSGLRVSTVGLGCNNFGMTKGKDFPSGSRLAELPFFKSMATEAAFDAVTRIEKAAAGAGLTVLEAALAWLVHQPTVCSVLVGATSPQQVAANVAAAGVPLSPEVVDTITTAASGAPGDAPD